MTEGRRVHSVVGVRFSPTGRVEYYDPGDSDLDVGDLVMVDTETGPKEGQVVIAPNQVLFSELRGELPRTVSKLDRREA